MQTTATATVNQLVTCDAVQFALELIILAMQLKKSNEVMYTGDMAIIMEAKGYVAPATHAPYVPGGRGIYSAIDAAYNLIERELDDASDWLSELSTRFVDRRGLPAWKKDR